MERPKILYPHTPADESASFLAKRAAAQGKWDIIAPEAMTGISREVYDEISEKHFGKPEEKRDETVDMYQDYELEVNELLDQM